MMRVLCLLAISVCLVTITVARPSNSDQEDEGETEEVQYDDNDESPADDTAQEEENSRFNDEEPEDASDDQETPRQPLVSYEREANERRAVEGSDADSENAMICSRKNKEEMPNKETPINNDQPIQKRRQLNRYYDGDDETPRNTQNFNGDHRENHIKNSIRNNILDKRTIPRGTTPNEENDLIFDYQRVQSDQRPEYNNEIVNPVEKPLHFRQYCKTMQAKQNNAQGDRSLEISKLSNRDRREAELESINLSSTSTEKASVIADKVNDDDEAAIKRHIKKLSGEELEELLNSLSDDKKALLNRIMDNNLNNDSLNKREITKKAGAMELNNYIDNSLSELTNNQGVSSLADVNTESAVAQNLNTENTKQEIQTESSDTTKTKASEGDHADTSDNKGEITGGIEETNINIKLDDNLKSNDNAKLLSSKIENKRETNLDNTKNKDESFEDTDFVDNFNIEDRLDNSFNYQNSLCSPQEEELTQLADNELHKDYKRQTYLDTQSDLDDSMTLLEESFPNSDHEELGPNLNMIPLVRVKRTHHNSKKNRELGSLNAKVAYAPYKIENLDNEGSEFDVGFNDCRSNYAKNKEDIPRIDVKDLKRKTENITINNKIESDTMKIGSDTDIVISGVEGVNDNLMYNSRSRNKRTLRINLKHQETGEGSNLLNSTDVLETSANIIKMPNYQESDAFGALPRSYDSELGRYKRVRRVKPASEITT